MGRWKHPLTVLQGSSSSWEAGGDAECHRLLCPGRSTPYSPSSPAPLFHTERSWAGCSRRCSLSRLVLLQNPEDQKWQALDVSLLSAIVDNLLIYSLERYSFSFLGSTHLLFGGCLFLTSCHGFYLSCVTEIHDCPVLSERLGCKV